jgi:glycosyltransferase involved in cell wall biosynthesis
MNKKSVLFIYQNFSSFVRTDFEILSSRFYVKKYQFKPTKGLYKTIFELVRQFVYLLINIWKYDAVYIWFADYFTLLPVIFTKLFYKKCFVVIGGYDVCRIEKFKYGALCSKLRGFFTVNSMKLSTINLTVSKHIDRKVKYLAPHSRKELIYNCANLLGETIENAENLILTIGIIDNERTFYLKGIDTFIEVAKMIPDYKFMLIGANQELLSNLLVDLPSNLQVFDKIPHDTLADYYKKAKFYCQFSRSESFGVAIVEAMSFGCIPVVTNEGGMPELVGDSKYIVLRDTAKIRETILSLTQDTNDDKQKRKNRALSLFSFKMRQEKLNDLVSFYIGNKFS